MNEQYQQEFTALSDRIWARPELRWAEHYAVEAQIEVAEAHGLTVTREIGGIPTAFSADRGHGGPVIAFLGEFDALAGLNQAAGSPVREPEPANPGDCGHGCGHHLLGTASLLATVLTAEYLEAHDLPGTVRYFGCPAEEASAGKAFMVARGAFDGVDAAFTWHPAAVTRVAQRHTLAYCQAYFHFTGRASHAGGSPELGRSALDAVELMNVGVNFLREHMPGSARVHYAILDAGGVSPNVVPAHASVYYVVRAQTVAEMRALYDRVRKIAEGAALMTETEVAIDYDGGCSELLANDVLDRAMSEVLQKLGPVPFDDADRRTAAAFLPGPAEVAAARRAAEIDPADPSPLHDGVVPFRENGDRPIAGTSTDVGDVSWTVPTAQCHIACDALATPAHSWQRVAQGKLPAAHKGMLHAAKVMAGTAVAAFTDPSLLAAARAEFDERLRGMPYDSPLPDGLLPPPLRAAPS
ncbi:amidohydrolase [Amycolatopsis jejuensis]|uniref:amidohydrolase n=1 Tax=Amycolatopsis jejuensis TaxID=330084 RepID=UPI000525B278|nr:amidohydrolase [Amycolatopsis jejuensis]